MPNIFDKSTADKMIRRVQSLTPEATPLWGSMNVTEMLLHCNMIQEKLLQAAKPSGKKTSVKQYLTRWLVLYVMPRYPKGAAAPKDFRTKGVIDRETFQEQQQRFIQNLIIFQQHTAPVEHYHPYFGKLNTKEWGITCWKHNDHHLRQFGV